MPDQGRRAEPSGRSSSSSITAATCGRRRTGWSPAIEHLLPWAARMPILYNAAVGSPPGRFVTKRLGLVALPELPGLSLDRELASRGIRTATPQRWRRCQRRSGRAASSSCRTPSPAISRRRSCSISSTCWPASASCPGWRPSSRTASPCTCTAFWAGSSAWPSATPRCSGRWRPRAWRSWVSTRR